MIDPTTQMAFKREDMLKEAEQERLAAQLPQSPSFVRRELAHAIYRLASWLDKQPDEYISLPESGPEDWVAGRAGV